MRFFWFCGRFAAFGEDESSLLTCLWSLYYCGHFLLQEMCKAATESVASSQTALQSELRRNANTGEYKLPVLLIAESQRSPWWLFFTVVISPISAAATRMIANSLSRDSPPSTPVRRPDSNASKISITVSNKMAGKSTKAGNFKNPWLNVFLCWQLLL